MSDTKTRETLTGTKRVVGTLELFAGYELVALGSDALEVVAVVLPACSGVRNAYRPTV